MTTETTFKQDYEKHLQHLELKGFQPKTIDAYSRAIPELANILMTRSMISLNSS